MKSKKILLGSLSTMALVATPIAAVISCDNDKASTDADKKAAFQAADLIKKIGKDDKGLVASFQMGPETQNFYVSEADAKKASTMKFLGHTLSFPALTAGATTLKVTVGTDAEVTTAKKIAREAAEKLAGAKQGSDAASIKAAGDAAANAIPGKQELPITITTAQEGQFIVNKRMVKATAADVATFLKAELTVKEGKGIYPFAFKEASLETSEPKLTVESKTAFDKIFTDLGLQVTALEFKKAKPDSKEITVKKFTIVEKTTQPVVTPSKQTDLTALKTALGNTITVTRTGSSGTRTTSADLSIKTKGESMTPAQFLAKLKGLIGGTSHIDPITTLVSGKIKDDMVITFSITTAAVAASAQGVTPVVVATPGAAVIKINADSFNEVTVPVTFTI